MIENLNNSLKKNYLFLILLLFPVCVLFRSALINIYFITCSLFFIFNLKKNKNFCTEKWMVIYFIFFVYICLLSFFVENQFLSFTKSIAQLRFFCFVFFLSILNISFKGFQKFIYCSAFLIIFVCLDAFYQYFNGYNVFGFKPGDPNINPDRLSGPFNEELIVGSYVFYVSIPIISYFISNYNKYSILNKIFIISFSVLVFFTILLSGERMPFILFLLSLAIIFLIYLEFKKILLLKFIFVIIIFLMYFFNQSVSNRFDNFFKDISNYKEAGHYKIFSSALVIWNNHKILGVGIKNFRFTCDVNKLNTLETKKFLCSTHPHNIYLELLVETGLIGFLLYIIFFVFLLTNIFQKIINIDKKLKGFFYGSLIIIFTYIWPIKSSGSLFSTFYASFLWFNIGIVFLILNSKININHPRVKKKLSRV